MEFEANGLPAELPDDQLTLLAEGFTAADERGLGLPSATGSVAVEGAMRDDAVAENLDPVDVKETITGLLTPAYSGFQTTVEQINGSREREKKIAVADQETVAAEFEAWFDKARLDYVKKTMEANPNLTWTLLATPNVTVTANEYLACTRAFGEGQPCQTAVWSDITKRYTPEEISGNDPSNDKAVKFKLVPNEFSPEVYGDVATQKAKLAELKAETPFLEATSPLEDLTWINTMRASGKRLVGSGTVDDATCIRNYTLEPKGFGENLRVPDLYVNHYGQLVVSGSGVQNVEAGRVSVG